MSEKEYEKGIIQMALLIVIALVNLNLHTRCDFTKVSPRYWHSNSTALVFFWVAGYNSGGEGFELLSFKLPLCLCLSASTNIFVITHSWELDVRGNLFCKDFLIRGMKAFKRNSSVFSQSAFSKTATELCCGRRF